MSVMMPARMSRFSLPQDPVFQQLNASISFDWRLGPYDLEQSRAHAKMLAEAGIISTADRDALINGLYRVADELDSGAFDFRPDDEDIHMAIERRLTEIVGPVGGKLHTARSRNDQVATDVALFVHERAHVARQMVCELMRLLAHFWRLRRDLQRFEFTAHQSQVMPLGSGALAGVNFETDRDSVAEELGF